MKNKFVVSLVLVITIVITLFIAGVFFFLSDFHFNSVIKQSKAEKDRYTDIESKENESENENYSTLELPAVMALNDVAQSEKAPFDRLSFVAVGDNIVHSSVYSDAADLGKISGKDYDFLPMFENVANIIKSADLAYINQESPFAGKEKTYSGYPMFNSPDRVGYDLMELGFDIINLANNHMLDRYAAGYQRTIDFWKDKDGITYIGGYENREDYENIRVIEKNGISIAFLSYTYGTNGINLDRGSEMIIPLCDDTGTSDIDRQTKKARELADIVMVSVHWGHEDWFQPSDLQKRQMEIMVNNGVDVIIGTHPHVLQPMMWKQRPDGGKTLVMYSLGNFLSGMLYVRNMVGGIAGFDIIKAGDKAFVTSPYFIPTVCQYNTAWRGFKIYKFSEYTDQLFSQHRTNRISDSGKSINYMRKIIDDAIPDEFLIEDFYRNVQ